MNIKIPEFKFSIALDELQPGSGPMWPRLTDGALRMLAVTRCGYAAVFSEGYRRLVNHTGSRCGSSCRCCKLSGM